MQYGCTLLLFLIMMFHYAFLRSLEIGFLLQRTTFLCYHGSFQHAQMGKLYTEISQPVLYKG